MKRFLFFGIAFLCWSFIQPAMAQNGLDPTRATLFAYYQKQAEKVLKAQDVALGMNLTGHKFLSEEVKKTTAFQQELNTYLSSLNDIITVAADLYGVYYEVDQILKNLRYMRKTISSCPGNVIAVALSPSRHNIYQDVIENGVQLAADIKTVLSAKNSQAERHITIGTIRKQLRDLNRKIIRFNFLLKYTTIMDAWYEVRGYSSNYHTRSMKQITKDSYDSWINCAKSVNSMYRK